MKINKYVFIIYYLIKRPFEFSFHTISKYLYDYNNKPKSILRLSIVLTIIVLFKENFYDAIFWVKPTFDISFYGMLVITLSIYIWKVLGKGHGSQWIEEYNIHYSRQIIKEGIEKGNTIFDEAK